MTFRRWSPSSRRDRRRSSRRSTSSARDDRSIFIVAGLFTVGIIVILILLAVFG